jgi:hypothetical protein
MAIESDFEDPQLSRILFQEPDFWIRGRQLAEALAPAGHFVLHVERDRATLDTAFELFAAAAVALRSSLHPEKSALIGLFKHRFRFLYNRAIVLAYCLHPGRLPPAGLVPICQDYISDRYRNDPALVVDLQAQFRHYLHRKEYFADPQLWTKEAISSPITWWRDKISPTNESTDALRALALGIFAIPASDAGVERSFKQMSLLQTPLRNRLSTEAAKSMAQVQTYLHEKYPKFATPRRHGDIFSPEQPVRQGGFQQPLVAMQVNDEDDDSSFNEFDDENAEADNALIIAAAEVQGAPEYYEEGDSNNSEELEADFHLLVSSEEGAERPAMASPRQSAAKVW